jgi:hypothetical protein
MPKILYIAGYSRSGSTILDIILSSHPEITGVGEVTFLVEDWAESSRHCSCGLPYQECDYWKGLFSNPGLLPELTSLVQRIEKRSSVPRLLLGAIPREDREVYRAYQNKLLAHVVAQTGGSIVVDSSKSARLALGRFVALHKLASQDVYVLHLVRDGFAVMESQLITGDNWVLEGRMASNRWPALRTVFGWVTTNLWVPLLGHLIGPDRYMLLRYEDFIEKPAETLQAIGQFCGFDAGPLVERIQQGDAFDVGHRVGGNRVRLQGKLKLERRPRRKHGDRLKVYQRAIFACLGGWLQFLYGYR